MNKRVVAILTAVMMIMGALAGCKDQSADATGSSKETPAAQEKEEADVSDKDAADDNTGSAEPVKIAGFYNLSGNSADTGVMAQQGIEMAVKMINDNGGIKSLGGAPVEVVYYDTMSDPTQAKGVADRALSDSSILAGVGIGGSAYGIPMLSSFEKNTTAFILNGTSDNFTNQGYKCIDRFSNDGAMFGATQVEFLKYLNESLNLGITKVGACYENTENGITNVAGAKAATQTAGLDWAYEETFQTGLTDASNIVVNMKKSGVQVIFMTAYSQDCKVLMNAMKSMNYNPLIIGSGAGFLFPAFRDEMGEEVEGILSVQTNPFDSLAASEELRNVAKEYEATYGDFMAEHAVGAFTAVQIAAAAIEKAGVRDRGEIMTACREVDIDTFVGKINFDENGQNTNIITAVVQWQKDEDSEFRPHCIFPDSIAAEEFQVTDDMKSMLDSAS